jgi:DNA ligase-1
MIPSTENTDQQRKAWIDAISSGFARRPVFSEMTNLLLRMKQEITVSEDAIENKISAINRYTTPRVGIPVLTMSAYPVSTILDVIKRMEGKSMACEYKYDGARIQVHVEIDKSTKKLIVGRIFSRNLEDNTEKFGSLLPVIQEALIRRESVTSFILEGEVVAIDPSTSALLPFQVLQAKTTTEFKLFAFDLLVINGESLLEVSSLYFS